MIPSTLITSIETEKAHGILRLTQLVDECGLERVTCWLRNIAAEQWRAQRPSPGTITDPRR